MKIPMKVDYGVRALVVLATQYGNGSVHSAEIAAQQSIPEAYLDQLLTTLHKYGFVKSRRGPQGGHALAKDPSEINLGSVVSSLEGNVPALDCLSAPDECSLSHSCAQREVWMDVEQIMHDRLSSITLADLVVRQQRLNETTGKRKLRSRIT